MLVRLLCRLRLESDIDKVRARSSSSRTLRRKTNTVTGRQTIARRRTNEPASCVPKPALQCIKHQPNAQYRSLLPSSPQSLTERLSPPSALAPLLVVADLQIPAETTSFNHPDAPGFLNMANLTGDLFSIKFLAVQSLAWKVTCIFCAEDFDAFSYGL